MRENRNRYTPQFKANVAIEALQNTKTHREIAEEFDIHPGMVGKWKKQVIERLPEIFNKSNLTVINEQETKKLKSKVTQLSMEVSFLEKKYSQLGAHANENS